MSRQLEKIEFGYNSNRPLRHFCEGSLSNTTVVGTSETISRTQNSSVQVLSGTLSGALDRPQSVSSALRRERRGLSRDCERRMMSCVESGATPALFSPRYLVSKTCVSKSVYRSDLAVRSRKNKNVALRPPRLDDSVPDRRLIHSLGKSEILDEIRGIVTDVCGENGEKIFTEDTFEAGARACLRVIEQLGEKKTLTMSERAKAEQWLMGIKTTSEDLPKSTEKKSLGKMMDCPASPTVAEVKTFRKKHGRSTAAGRSEQFGRSRDRVRSLFATATKYFKQSTTDQKNQDCSAAKRGVASLRELVALKELEKVGQACDVALKQADDFRKELESLTPPSSQRLVLPVQRASGKPAKPASRQLETTLLELASVSGTGFSRPVSRTRSSRPNSGKSNVPSEKKMKRYFGLISLEGAEARKQRLAESILRSKEVEQRLTAFRRTGEELRDRCDGLQATGHELDWGRRKTGKSMLARKLERALRGAPNLNSEESILL